MVTGVESQLLHYIELTEVGRYCAYKGRKDWRGALKDCSKGEAMTFLGYICENNYILFSWRSFCVGGSYYNCYF